MITTTKETSRFRAVSSSGALLNEERIADELEMTRRVLHRLRGSSYRGLHAVSCECLGGRLILEGRVPTYYLKQVAQSLVLAAVTDAFLINRIEVVPPRRHDHR